MNKLILILPILASCNYDTHRATFGDGAAEISIAFCERRAQCGFAEPPVTECVAFNLESLCERYDCEKVLTSSQEDMFAKCAEDFEQWQCGPFLPASCYEVLELR